MNTTNKHKTLINEKKEIENERKFLKRFVFILLLDFMK